jgi:beta-glucosidase/6-phospho-beta-glucosidase/beta-galactosidase
VNVKKLLFATGIECSYPTVQGGTRRDQLEETGHYDHWRQDFQLCVDLGARVVRYGPPYYKMHLGPDNYDWSFTDEVLPVMKQMGLIPILDLCHFGVPDWVGDFQNDDWPALFADYARAFAKRYPWITLYTPVNEIYVCARFSALEGIWNEQLKSEKAMLKAHGVQCKATLLAIEAIREVTPNAVFFQSEACEAYLETQPGTREEIALYNSMRFITFDFLYGHPPDGDLLNFLYDHGITREQYDWFMEHGRKASPYCVMGMDYYEGHEQTLKADGTKEKLRTVIGWGNIAREYFKRYRKPMMLTETNTGDPENAPEWLWKTWHNLALLREEGLPAIGYTWFSLQNQVDWDIQLREIRGVEVGNGLYRLDRTPNPVAAEFRDLCTRYSEEPLLPAFNMGQMSGQIDDASTVEKIG